ncbi:helix-turn-helix domain-containing protein [Sutcliffiella halmapala]
MNEEEKDAINAAFGRALKRKRRIELDLGQKKIEEIANLGHKTITKLEQGERGPSFLTLFKLRVLAGISIDELIEEAVEELKESGLDLTYILEKE